MKQLGAGTLFGWKSGHISGSGSKSNVFGPVISVILTVVVARLLTTAWWRICSRRCRSSPTRFRPDPTLKLFLAGIYDTSILYIFCIKIYCRHFQEIMTIFFLARKWLAWRKCSWMFFLISSPLRFRRRCGAEPFLVGAKLNFLVGAGSYFLR